MAKGKKAKQQSAILTSKTTRHKASATILNEVGRSFRKATCLDQE
jgi:hypothetical protein